MWLARYVRPALNVSLVTLIFKREEPSICGNYRPTAFGSSIKVYASILNLKLPAITEELGYRSPAQCAFRSGLSALHPLFGLQTELCASRGDRLYCCFLKAAYDHISRPLR